MDVKLGVVLLEEPIFIPVTVSPKHRRFERELPELIIDLVNLRMDLIDSLLNLIHFLGELISLFRKRVELRLDLSPFCS